MSVSVPEYYLGGNVKLLGETWKNHGSGLAIYARSYIQNVIPKFESILARGLYPSRHQYMKDIYHPDVDDSLLCKEDDSTK
jgi:hypothetical protein